MLHTMGYLPVHVVRAGAGAATVTVSAISGLEAAGYLGGVIGAVVALAALYVTISANNRTRRRESEDEIQEAYDRGAAERDRLLRPWLEFYQDQLKRIPSVAPVPVPPPPAPPAATPTPPPPVLPPSTPEPAP